MFIQVNDTHENINIIWRQPRIEL